MKNTLLFLIILTTIILQSCQVNKDRQYRNEIVGEWKFSRSENQRQTHYEQNVPPPPPWGNVKEGFSLAADGTFESMLGFIDRESESRTFLGFTTRYEVKNDSLIITIPKQKCRQIYKIASITNDSLYLQTKDSFLHVYSKSHYFLNPKEHYNKIIISSSTSLYPFRNISISDNGDIIYGTSDSLSSAQITKAQFNLIENNFKKTSIPLLKEHYCVDGFDFEAISISFIRDNKIFKTITDFGWASPTEVYWAFLRVAHLQDHLILKPLYTKMPVVILNDAEFHTKYTFCRLTQSENFLLTTELLRSKEARKMNRLRYVLSYYDVGKDQRRKIKTDGEEFEIDGKIYDLGYNFLQRNNLTSKFKKKDTLY